MIPLLTAFKSQWLNFWLNFSEKTIFLINYKLLKQKKERR